MKINWSQQINNSLYKSRKVLLLFFYFNLHAFWNYQLSGILIFLMLLINCFFHKFPTIGTCKKILRFLGGTVIKNWPASAGDTGLIPGQGRFHVQLIRQLKPISHNYWSLRAQNLYSATNRNHHSEKPVHCNQRGVPSPQLEKARTQQQRPSATSKYIIKIKF